MSNRPARSPGSTVQHRRTSRRVPAGVGCAGPELAFSVGKIFRSGREKNGSYRARVPTLPESRRGRPYHDGARLVLVGGGAKLIYINQTPKTPFGRPRPGHPWSCAGRIRTRRRLKGPAPPASSSFPGGFRDDRRSLFPRNRSVYPKRVVGAFQGTAGTAHPLSLEPRE